MVDYTLTPNKSLIKPNRGTYVDTWDTPLNSDWDYVDRALGGTYTVPTTTGAINLTIDQARYQQIKLPNSSDTNPRVLQFPLVDGSSTDAVGGMWVVDNTLSTQGIVVTTAAPGSSQLTIPANKKQLVFSNGSGIYFADDIRVTAGTGLEFSGTALQIKSPIATGIGGTGQAGGYTSGQLLIGKADGTLAKATLTAGTNVTITNGDGTITINSTASGGTSGLTAISFSGTTGLTFTNITTTNTSSTVAGTLVVGNGGTGATSLTGYVKGNGTSAFTASSKIPVADLDGGIAIANGGTGATTAATALANLGGAPTANPTFTGTANFNAISFSSISGSAYNFTANTSIAGQSNAIQMNVSGSAVVEMSSTLFQCNKTPYAHQTNWSLISDERSKKNIVAYTKSLNDVISLNPVTFQYNGQYGTQDDGVTRVGLIAQQVSSSSMPELVGTYVYKDPKTGQTTNLYNLNPSDLMFAFINSIKALEARVKELEAKVGP